MKLIIENIGSITRVAVELGNLTVIAGENDVGKSTVGRVFFALVQAFSNYPVALKKMQDTRIRQVLERILIDIRRHVSLAQHPEFRRLFSPPHLGERHDLELLIKGDYVREDTILILDEPETSLHPKWQIAYAKIICALTKLGAKVLVTTHSPYMLEALKGYSSKNAENYFYLAQKESDNAIHYHDTSGDISPIIAALSQPLEDLIDEIGHDF